MEFQNFNFYSSSLVDFQEVQIKDDRMRQTNNTQVFQIVRHEA